MKKIILDSCFLPRKYNGGGEDSGSDDDSSDEGVDHGDHSADSDADSPDTDAGSAG